MPESLAGSKIGQKALAIAISEAKVGAREIGGNNLGEFVEKYHQNNPMYKGQPWCAPFVRWCFMQVGEGKLFQKDDKFDSSAISLFNQCVKLGIAWDFKPNAPSERMPEPGDLIFWWRGKTRTWMGHVGIVYDSNFPIVRTIEGNRTPEVKGFEYDITDPNRTFQLLGFAHLPDERIVI